VRTSAFVDTSGWLAVVSARQLRHAEAVDAYIKLLKGGTRLVTCNLVVAEMHALILRERDQETAVRFLDQLYSDPAHEVLFVDRELEARAIDRWLRPFREQRFSLADAVSFELMRQEGIRTALALDRHFRVAGFETVP
jgi:predicted nucleic acid-binding protein